MSLPTSVETETTVDDVPVVMTEAEEAEAAWRDFGITTGSVFAGILILFPLYSWQLQIIYDSGVTKKGNVKGTRDPSIGEELTEDSNLFGMIQEMMEDILEIIKGNVVERVTKGIGEMDNSKKGCGQEDTVPSGGVLQGGGDVKKENLFPIPTAPPFPNTGATAVTADDATATAISPAVTADDATAATSDDATATAISPTAIASEQVGEPKSNPDCEYGGWP